MCVCECVYACMRVSCVMREPRGVYHAMVPYWLPRNNSSFGKKRGEGRWKKEMPFFFGDKIHLIFFSFSVDCVVKKSQY